MDNIQELESLKPINLDAGLVFSGTPVLADCDRLRESQHVYARR